MLMLHQPEQIQTITDPGIKTLLELRYGQLGSIQGFIIVESGDSVQALEQASQCPIVTSLFDDVRFPDDDFEPAFEVLEDHGHCYEMVFIFSDDDTGTVLLIPKQEGIDTDLLSFCQTFAVPA